MHGNNEETSTRQVKVDNWGPFFLQRLQHFFNKNDFCDLTLLFCGDIKVQVHSLVLNACTDYFQTLEKKNGLNEGSCLVMPSDLTSELVLPIIKFMYTGKLEFKDCLTKKLYYTAGRLNMPILTKLLDAQGSSDSQVEKTVKNNVPNLVSKNAAFGTRKVPSKELPETLPGRRLPIWKKRKAPVSFDDPVPENLAISEHHYEQDDEPAKPTRFEWPEDEDALKNYSEEYSQPFDSITYESAPLLRHKATPVKSTEEDKPKDTFEEVKSKVAPIKRLAPSNSESASKKPKMIDIQSVKEYLQEQAVRKQIVSNEEDGEETMEEESMAITETAEDDDDDEDDRGADPLTNDDSTFTVQEESMEESTSSGTPQTKSILKQRLPEEGNPGAKKVRFSLTGQPATSGQPQSQATTVVHTTSETIIRADGNSAENHAKIISEVLKKYPHLVQNNKNIKLRIMKQGTYPEDSGNKKVSYVVLKAGEKGTKSPAKVIVKTGGSSRNESLTNILPSPPVIKTKPVSGAENITGPWLCHTCGSNEDPVNFETYFEYRRHLQEVHMEKIDARICEHCGHRASKRNLLLYHLFTKHNVQPPRNVVFPKCDQCEYIALSESLLIKHRNNHSNAKDFVCKVCNAGFKSNGALQGHMQANLHSDPAKKKYECPYCHKIFIRHINLKTHVRSAHKDISDKKLLEDLDEGSADGVLIKKMETVDGMVLEQHHEGMTSGLTTLGLVDHSQLEVDQHAVVQSIPNADGTVQTFIISAVPGQEYIVPEMLTGQAAEQYQISASQLADLVQYDGASSVVSSLGATGSQQTIVITSAPSGGHEQLKLISADGSTITGSLDQLALLTSQNILVTNADGTTTTAGEAGFQAILQPNGVLTLQQVGQVIQADGETVTEETLVQQGYVTSQGNILTVAQQEDKDGAANLIQFAEMDNKTYVTYQQQALTGEMTEGVTVTTQDISIEHLTAVQSDGMQDQMHMPVENQVEVENGEHLQQQEHLQVQDHLQSHEHIQEEHLQHEEHIQQEEHNMQQEEHLQEEHLQSHEHLQQQEQLLEEHMHAQDQVDQMPVNSEEYQPEHENNDGGIPIESVPIEIAEELNEELEKEMPDEATETSTLEVQASEAAVPEEIAPAFSDGAPVDEQHMIVETVSEVEPVEKELVIEEEQPKSLSEQVESLANTYVVQNEQPLDANDVDNETESMIIDEGDQSEMVEQSEAIETLTEGNPA